MKYIFICLVICSCSSKFQEGIYYEVDNKELLSGGTGIRHVFSKSGKYDSYLSRPKIKELKLSTGTWVAINRNIKVSEDTIYSNNAMIDSSAPRIINLYRKKGENWDFLILKQVIGMPKYRKILEKKKSKY